MDKEVKKTPDERGKIQSNLLEYVEDVASSVDRVEDKLDKAGEALKSDIQEMRKDIKTMGDKQDSVLVKLYFLVKNIELEHERDATMKEDVEDLGNRVEKLELAMTA